MATRTMLRPRFNCIISVSKQQQQKQATTTTAGSIGFLVSRQQAVYSTTAPKKAKNRVYNPVRTEDEFETLNLLSSSSRTPLVTLWTASWCPSCKIVGPLIKDLVESGVGEAQGGVGFAEVQLDSPTIGPLMMRYTITSMPTLLSFDRQEPQLSTRVTSVDDMKSRRFLTEWIEREAKRHGQGGGGGTGSSIFSSLFGSSGGKS